MTLTDEQRKTLNWFVGVPDAPPQEPSDDTRVTDLEERIATLRRDLRDRNAQITALETQLRTVPPADGHLARNEAEGRFYEEAAERRGWRISKAGWPDYFCVAEDGAVTLVAVLPGKKSRLRREQLRVLKALASLGVPCVRWSPNLGFEKFRGNTMTVLEFLRRTRRLSQTQLGEATSVPQETISQIERGATTSAENLERLAALLLPPGQDPVSLLREVSGSLLQGATARTVPAAASTAVVP